MKARGTTLQVTPLYTDDLCNRFPHLLHAWPVEAPHAHAYLRRMDTAPAFQIAGVHSVLTDADVPGENDTGSSRHDEPLFPSEVMYHRQPVCLGARRNAGGRA